MAAALSASGYGPLPYPPLVLAVAQIVLGTWLGATFRREIVTSALWLSLISVATALLLLLLCSLVALAIAAVSGVDGRTLVNFVPVSGHWGTLPLSVKGAPNGTTSTEIYGRL